MLLPDEENFPDWLRAELEALRATLGPDPDRDALREARRRLSPRARAYLRELAVRAYVAEVALEMLASGELTDVRGDDEADDAGEARHAPADRPEGLGW